MLIGGTLGPLADFNFLIVVAVTPRAHTVIATPSVHLDDMDIRRMQVGKLHVLQGYGVMRIVRDNDV